MRGKAFIHFPLENSPGITPAYAGKRNAIGVLSLHAKDHPRVCGEKTPMLPCFVHPWGSPPRMRGKAKPYHLGPLERRITPAYAGKRAAMPALVRRPWDHPRVCGEKTLADAEKAVAAGSPPRMRGKVRERKTGKTRRRITPAYAGKRRRSTSYFLPYWDHPRVCGEKLFFVWFAMLLEGSPPRMRGKVQPIHFPHGIIRITPAYAGKRRLKHIPEPARQDHPRVCGEKTV